MAKPRRGLFIVFEGIDGCGKTYQTELLYNHIKERTPRVELTREPFYDLEIRKILKEDQDPYSKSMKLAELFIEDREKHLEEFIIPKLDGGYNVLCDRYALSTLAYQHSQGIELDQLVKMHKNLVIPDITFLIDLPVEIAMERRNKDGSKGKEKKFEEIKEFQEKVRQNYLKLPAYLNKNADFLIRFIDGNGGKEEVFGKIKPIFEKVWEGHYGK